MSTVLWANLKVAGRVESNQVDYRFLYKHGKQLDTIARSLKLRPFLDLCDTTDQQVNLDLLPLPPGMTSTDELMAARGVWMPAADAAPWLQALHDHIVQQGIRFGLLRND